MQLRQLTYTDNGVTKLTRKWYGVFADHRGVIRKLSLFADRKNAAEAARNVERLVHTRAAGDLLPPELSRFLENTLPAVRKKLAEWDIIDATRVAAGKTLEDHLKDWGLFLSAKGNTSDYVALVTSRARAIFTACKFTFWSDITAEQIQAQLAEMRTKKEGAISIQTSNFYLQAAKQFCKWMSRTARRATESPLAHLSGLNVKADRRHDRRAFSVEEFLWLLKTTKAGPVRAKMGGEERALLYRLAVETGLRRGGLARLTTSSFELEGKEPAIIIKAGARNKYKNERRVPLKLDTAGLLKQHLQDKLPDAVAFQVPPKQHSAKMIKADLQAARDAWLNEATNEQERQERQKTSFLLYQDATGRFLDFHALRHTRGVWLFEHHKAHPREVQELMGVGSMALVDRYTRSFRLTDLRVVERGPDLTISAEPMSQNDGAAGDANSKTLSPGLSPGAGFGQICSDAAGLFAESVFQFSATEKMVISAGKPVVLTANSESDRLFETTRRSGRAVECAGLENR
jgi:integrase